MGTGRACHRHQRGGSLPGRRAGLREGHFLATEAGPVRVSDAACGVERSPVLVGISSSSSSSSCGLVVLWCWWCCPTGASRGRHRFWDHPRPLRRCARIAEVLEPGRERLGPSAEFARAVASIDKRSLGQKEKVGGGDL